MMNGALAGGAAMVYEWEEIDKERFIKQSLAGLRQAAGLTKAGLAVRAGRSPTPDETWTGHDHAVDPHVRHEEDRQLQWVRELLDKQFLFRTPYDGKGRSSSTSAPFSTAIGSGR
jgi:hypothetical protein